jgi:methionyl-tRNA formyltransferase
MSDKVIGIAGKNSIAINVLDYVKKRYPNYKILGCVNKTDNLINSWQYSFGKYCIDNEVEIVKLEDLYSIPDLYLLSLEYDRLINTDRFTSKNLFNIHFSLLPAYKGMYTSALPILHGAEYSGVTLHLIDNGIDTGDIIAHEKIAIDEHFTCRDLYLSYLCEGEKLVIANVDKLINNNYTITKQPSLGSSYFSKRTIDYKNILLNVNKTACEIERQIRAYNFREYQLPVFLGFQIYKAVIMNSKSYSKPGTVLFEDTFSIKIASVDYDIELRKDQLEELHSAAKSGDLGKIKQIHATGFDVKVKDKNGWDILIIASYNGRFNVVEWIIESNLLNINTTNYNGTTAVMYAMTYAAQTKDKSIMNYLISKGANLTLIDEKKLDIFHYANMYDIDIYYELNNIRK